MRRLLKSRNGNNAWSVSSSEKKLPPHIISRLFWIWGSAGWIALISPWAYGVTAGVVALFFHLGILETWAEQRQMRLRNDSLERR